MFGLHVGVHLDHAQALLDAGRWRAATGLQFGRGLLLAEALAMVAELAALTGHRLTPGQRQQAGHGIADRVGRLPRLPEWGPRLAPDSPTMARAAALPQHEFLTLPTLATAYVLAPLRLLRTGFAHSLIPPPLRGTLLDAPEVKRLSDATARARDLRRPTATSVRC